MSAPTFQRARRPEHVQARRDAILSAAGELVATKPIADITLRELAEGAGIAKSNVLRYFDSREAVLLELLDERWGTWLDAFQTRLPELPAADRSWGRETAFAALLAESIAADRPLCVLVGAMSSVLERNVTLESARGFKMRAHEHSARFERIIAGAFPRLAAPAVEHFGAAVLLIVTGLWAFAEPTPILAQVQAELGMPSSDVAFVENLRRALRAHLVGVTVVGD